MNGWLALLILFAVLLLSIYLIAKGLEIFLRGTKGPGPTRLLDLMVGAAMLIPGVAAAIYGFFWLLPLIQK